MSSVAAYGILGIVGGAFLLIIAWYLLQLIAGWKVFVKMGEEGWKSLIPIYGGYVQFTHVWNGTMYWVYLACSIVMYWIGKMNSGSEAGMTAIVFGLLSFVIAIVSLVINVMFCNNLAKAFGRGIGFTIGLFFLRPIFLLLLGFGDAEYVGNPTGYSPYEED